ERLNGIQEVVGSIPIISTTQNRLELLRLGLFFCCYDPVFCFSWLLIQAAFAPFLDIKNNEFSPRTEYVRNEDFRGLAMGQNLSESSIFLLLFYRTSLD
ncbi:MAG: hypothetical protein RR194_03100, partial [Ruthenibacterium sp.]